jgi:glycolate oxidase FAD binding subunit
MCSQIASSNADRFVSALAHSIGSGSVRRDGLREFEVDGMTPAVAVAPATIDELQAALREASQERFAVVPVGGGQHLTAGNTPSAYDIALQLTRLDTMVAHEPADMTVTVQAGMRLATLNEQLALHGQTLPLDPPCGPEATVGGVLAANAYGPRRHALGTARDWLIGTQVAHADGSVSRSGGRVVKNVTGYDMHKLYVGSLGTLAVLAEATFKLAPLPKVERTLTASFDSARAACGAVLATRDARLAVQAAEILSPAASAAVCGESRWVLLMRVAGGPAAVERSLRDLPFLTRGATISERDDASVWQTWAREFKPRALALRAAMLPSAVAPAIEALDRALAGSAQRLSATVAAGVIRIVLDAAGDEAAIADRAKEIVSLHSGSVVIDAASPPLKGRVDVFGASRSDLVIMRRLKEQFDPQGTLAPGRFAGRL